MSNNFKTKKFQELLDRLQQDSWQLELIISGFAIFGLFTALPEIKLALTIAGKDKQLISLVITTVALLSCYILIFNLLLHVILRGLWIGALGLRYVSGDIDYEALKYHNRFEKYLKKKIISFDRYVAILENYCSVLFAVSFLLIFYVISITITMVLITLIIVYILENDSFSKSLQLIIGLPLIIFIGSGAIFTFLDFISQGFLKKKKIISKIYFPFYWVFSFITLSFLYRPLVYNFLDNKFTKRISVMLIPIYLIIAFLGSITFQTSNYIDSTKRNSNIYLNNQEYEDLLTEKSDLVQNTTIQSKVITDPYINIFKVFSEALENQIYKYHPSLTPKNDRRGFQTGFKFKNGENKFSTQKRDSLAKKYIEVFNEMYEIHIDSSLIKSEFLITKNIKNQIGFQTYIPTKNLNNGKHILQLKRKYIRTKDTVKKVDVIIPFWYFKN